MKTIKNILIIGILCFVFLNTYAQDKETKKFEVGISGFYGISGLRGSVTNGSISPGLGSQFSVDGKYFFSSNVGIGIGAGYAVYNSQGKLNSYSSNTPAIDDESESFEYRIAASGISETLNLSAFEIPVFMAFRKSLSEKIGLFGNAGLKVSLPLSANYQSTEGTLTTKGYYASKNVEYADLLNHGFETINNISFSGDLSTFTAYSLIADLDVRFYLGKIGLNIGTYGSYGLSPILKPKSNLLIDYPGNYKSLSTLSEKVSLLSFGLRLGINF